MPEEPEELRDNPDAPAESEKELVVEDTQDHEADFERLLEMDEDFPEAL